MAIFKKAGLGWDFETELEDATHAPTSKGLALRKIRHDNYNFAEDVRLVGMWLTLATIRPGGLIVKAEKKFVVVATPTFQVSPVRVIEPGSPKSAAQSGISGTFDYLKSSASGLKFSEYFEDGKNYLAYGLIADFESPNLFSDLGVVNCEEAGLSIQQTLLFSRYGKSPPHEPSGKLDAARFHPMIAYALINNSDCDHHKDFVRVISLRFDFRLHLSLDFTLEKKNTSGVRSANHAGLFADSDYSSLRSAGRALGGVAYASFSAAEKPLVREIAAPGLILGKSTGDMSDHGDVICWDNLHWWGAGSMISAPGAFHAAHMHWRWGEILSTWAGRAMSAAWRRFNPGDALVDPRAHAQDLNIAVTKYSDALDPLKTELKSLTRETWSDLFHVKNKPLPYRIRGGDDIVLWYSTEVRRYTTPANQEGAVFLHGVYFAHNAEPGVVSQTGSRDEITGPGDSAIGEATIDRDPRWFRTPDNWSGT